MTVRIKKCKYPRRGQEAPGEVQTSPPYGHVMLQLVFFVPAKRPYISKEKFDLDKTQSFLAVLKTFKFAAILVQHSHQSSLRFE